jgi:anhydro-N-acetylmuramic acid kinase
VIAIGLMSGTSLDGVDAALVSVKPRGESYSVELKDFATIPFDDELSSLIRAALPPETPPPAVVADLDRRIGVALAEAARCVAGAVNVAYVASHGLTLFHDGARHITMQIGDAFVLREALHATVCFDFRTADCVAGGEGAPLVPYVDALLLGSAGEDRVALNVGGIANITALPKGCRTDDAVAFDTGPGVMLVDAFVRSRTKGAAVMDSDGALAARGGVDELLLGEMLADPFFARPYPKSTGRERFGPHFLDRHATLERLSIEDGAATLTELTAVTVARAIESIHLEDARVLCSGGGTRNGWLMRRLAARLPRARIESTESFGLPVDAKEAIAFAVLGYETLRERAANIPRVTGARGAVTLGSIAPWKLRELLVEVDAECRSL